MIDGAPAAVEAAADALERAAEDMHDAADDIGSHGRAVTADWVGTASDAAGDSIAQISTRAGTGADAMAGAPRVLRTFAAELRRAQQAWQAASDAAAAGARAAESARGAQRAADAMDEGFAEQASAKQAAQERAGRALANAHEDVQAAHHSMASAVARSEQANTAAATLIDGLTAELAGMQGATSTASVCTADGHGSGAEAGAGLWDPTATSYLTAGYRAGGDDPSDLVDQHGWAYNTLGGLGEAAWQMAPGAISGLLHLSGGAMDDSLDRSVADGIDDAHDWLVDWYGADTDTSAYQGANMGGTIASFFVGGGELRVGAKGAEMAAGGARAFEATRALSAAERARVAALPTRYHHLEVVTAASGSKGAWTRALNKPEADRVYMVDDRHAFVTDSKGRVEHVDSQLEYRDPSDVAQHRNGYQQGVAGRGDRLQFDQGGHLVAASLGGPGEGINLVAMQRELNGASSSATWGAMENDLRTILKGDPNADIKFRVDLEYSGTSTRPSGMDVRYSVDGQDPIRRFFSNE